MWWPTPRWRLDYRSRDTDPRATQHTNEVVLIPTSSADWKRRRQGRCSKRHRVNVAPRNERASSINRWFRYPFDGIHHRPHGSPPDSISRVQDEGSRRDLAPASDMLAVCGGKSKPRGFVLRGLVKSRAFHQPPSGVIHSPLFQEMYARIAILKLLSLRQDKERHTA